MASGDVYATIDEGFMRSPTEPFLVKKVHEFSHISLEDALTAFRLDDDCVSGWGDKYALVENLRLADLVEQWLNDSLGVNVLNSPLSTLQCPRVLTEFFADDAPGRPEVTPILTPAQGYARFHTDPPESGGGWMYLWQGHKHWEIVSWRSARELLVDGATNPDGWDLLHDATAAELSELPGVKVYSFDMEDGDFLYFPPGWIHRVWTTRKAIGISGYILIPGAREEAQAAALELNAIDYR